MTKALEEAFAEASKLPEQNAREILERLADEAIADYRAGRTRPVDPDKM